MLVWYHSILQVFILIALALAVFYSFSYRRKKNPVIRGIHMARMNMCLGILLLLGALLQATMFEMNSSRLVILVLFTLLGLFNLFAGLKNHKYFRSQLDTGSNQ